MGIATQGRCIGWAEIGRIRGAASQRCVPELRADEAPAAAKSGLRAAALRSCMALKPTSSPTILDYPDEVLGQFDYVVASIHSRFRLSQEEQTERLLRAVRNPFTTVLGHLTGRLLKRREGYSVVIPRVLAASAEAGVAVEINANPHRLDLDWRWHPMVRELGTFFQHQPGRAQRRGAGSDRPGASRWPERAASGRKAC